MYSDLTNSYLLINPLYLSVVLMAILLQIVLGVIIANLFEWLVHKYVLHGLGKKKRQHLVLPLVSASS